MHWVHFANWNNLLLHTLYYYCIGKIFSDSTKQSVEKKIGMSDCLSLYVEISPKLSRALSMHEVWQLLVSREHCIIHQLFNYTNCFTCCVNSRFFDRHVKFVIILLHFQLTICQLR